MGKPELNAFLSHLAVREHVSASTQTQALSALVFLYRNVLGREIGLLDGVVRAKRPARLPVVLTRDEARQLFANVDGVVLLAMVDAGAYSAAWHEAAPAFKARSAVEEWTKTAASLRPPGAVTRCS